MHRVLEHIDRHLDQPLDLERLVAVAFFSPFHFHRLFAAWMGETLGDYLRRRRLEIGALRLVAQPELTVLQAALGVGFGSAEAFSRGFKLHFGLPPSGWRSRERSRKASRESTHLGQNRNPDQELRNPNQAAAADSSYRGPSTNATPEGTMHPKLIERSDTPVAYLRHVGPYGPELSEFWQRAVYPWMATNDLLGRPRIGISHDDPAITRPARCRYDACVEVPPDRVLSGRHLRTVVPGGTYAVLGFRGTVTEVGRAWAGLLREWLPASGLQLDARPFFEFYPPDASFDRTTGVFTLSAVRAGRAPLGRGIDQTAEGAESRVPRTRRRPAAARETGFALTP